MAALRVPGAGAEIAFLRNLLATDSRAVVAAALVGGMFVLAVGVVFGLALNIWMDEAFTLQSTGAGPLTGWLRATDFEAQPPLYFVVEAAWRQLNETSIAFARLPSALFAGAAVAVLVFAAHRIVPRVPPVIVAFVTAGNPLFLWAASEMRLYALALLLGSGLTWMFFEAFLAPNRPRQAWIWYTALAVAGLYTQYYVGFVLLAHGIALALVRRDALRAFGASMAIVAVLFAPYFPVALVHLRVSGSFVSNVGPFAAAHEVFNTAFVYLLPHDVNWSGSVKWAGFASAGVLLLFVAAGAPAATGPTTRGLALHWLAALVIFSLLFAVVGVPQDPERHLIVLAPPSTLVALLALASLTRRRFAIAATALVAFAVFAGGTLCAQYRPPLAKRGDWLHVAALLGAEARDVPVAVFPAETALPLAVYWSRPVVPVPHPMPVSVDYVRATTLTGEAEVAAVLDPLRARSARLWVVTTVFCGAPELNRVDYHCRYLEAYLDRYYRLTQVVPFRGSEARLFERLASISSRHRMRTHGG